MRTLLRTLAAVAMFGSVVIAGAGDAGAEPSSYFERASFVDPTGDGHCNADINAFQVDYRYDVLRVTSGSVCWTDPRFSGNWIVGATNFSWYLDVNGDLQDDFVVVTYNDGSGVTAGVFDVRGGIDPVFLCGGTPEFTTPSYGAQVDPTCFGDPSTVRVQAYAQWDESPFSDTCICQFDVAPDGGYSAPIVRKEFVPTGDGPAAATSGPGVVDVFARGADNALWTQHMVNGVAGGWQSLGGIITGTAAAASAAPGEVDVFVRGQDNALWTRHHGAGGWSEWSSLGGVLSTPAAAASSAPGTLDVFAAGADRALYARHFNGTSWGGWVSLGGIITAAPAAASSSPGTLDVYVRGNDRALWTQHYAGSWGGWSSLGGIIDAAPSAASPAPGVVDVFARGADDALWRRSSDGWHFLDGQIAGPPAAVFAGSDRYVVFARGGDFALWITTSADGGTSWSGWTSLGGIIR